MGIGYLRILGWLALCCEEEDSCEYASGTPRENDFVGKCWTAREIGFAFAGLASKVLGRSFHYRAS